jgi:hypothetical protein
MSPEGSLTLTGTLTADRVETQKLVTDQASANSLVLGKLHVATTASELADSSDSLNQSELSSRTDLELGEAPDGSGISTSSATLTNAGAFAPSIGSASLPPRRVRIFVRTVAVSENSKVFITPTSLTNMNLAVTDIKPGLGFIVGTTEASSEALNFNWWIVN